MQNEHPRPKSRQYLAWSLVFLLLGHTGFTLNPCLDLQQSQAYQQYQMRPESDLSRLIYLMDWFKEAEVEVLYNGALLDAEDAAKEGKRLLQRYYRQETAEEWVQLYTYKSPDGEIITVQFPDGNAEKLRRVFMRELKTLNQLSRAA